MQKREGYGTLQSLQFMQSGDEKLQTTAPIAVFGLYLFLTGSEERNQLRHCSLPTLGFFKICRFWYSSLMPSNFIL